MNKFSISLSSLLLLLCGIFFITCQKELSFDGAISGGTGTGIAMYTLDGGGGICTNAVVNGTYVAGSALTSSNSNSVVINVNVTGIGTYTLTTDTLDGISFSSSGTFTTVGNQSVTLNGTGTPVFPRNLIFTPLAGTSYCTFPVSVDNPQPVATYVLESGFGNPNPCIYTLAGNYTATTPLNNSNTLSMHVFVTIIGNFTVATNTVNGMMFSYTGTFTTIGSQTVTLNGTGTPMVPASDTLTPRIIGPHPLGGQACAFVVPVQ